MSSKIIYVVLFLIASSCKEEKPVDPFSISKLYVGFANIDAFKENKGDSVKYLPSPPPPFNEEIANNNFVEANDGKVYFYSFSKRQPLCGFMTENSKDKFELYKQDLDTLAASSLRIVDRNNADNIIKQITNEDKSIYVSIGIQKDSSTNEILTRITTSLYRNSKNNVWKIREINKREKQLLNE